MKELNLVTGFQYSRNAVQGKCKCIRSDEAFIGTYIFQFHNINY